MVNREAILIRALKEAIASLHGADARHVQCAHVKESFDDQTAWEGEVHIFELKGHPTATRCYAWASPVEGSDKLRYYAVLHQPPVDSPEAAVRASIVQDHREGRI